ncbi:MAG: hypothetical protein C4288_01985 [Leptolyngbya sp. ERB_1_1]
MKPDFSTMSRKELKEYVLQNREDDEAIRAYLYHPDAKWITMPPMFDESGNPIEENIKFAEETLKQLGKRQQPE